MTYLILYALSGVVAGFVAGLLGLGGGVILVPALALLFSWQHFPDAVTMPLALGTSLAAVIFTSSSSTRAHHTRGAIEWRAVRGMTPGIVAGTLLSASVAAHVSSPVLKILFGAYVGVVATQLLWNFSPPAKTRLPGTAGLSIAGSIIGMISGLAGVGGATASVPFLMWCNLPARVAMATGAAIALPIALSGTLGYIAYGSIASELPSLALGYVYLPALAGIVIGVSLATPMGVRVSYRLPVPVLKRMLAAVLYCVMLRSALSWI